MGDGAGELGSLGRSERHALVELLVRATAAAGGEPDPRLPALVAAAPIDALPVAAVLHRVAGSVRRALDGVDGVPGRVMAALETSERQAAVRHLRAVRALGPVARELDAAGVRWVVMKGPVLAAALYPGIGDRSYNDLDLLVSRRDFATAMAIIEELGYAHAIHDWARAEEMLAGEVSLFTADVSIDLHWHLHYSSEDRRRFALDPEGMIERRRRLDVSGVDVATFDAVDTVSSLAFHAARSDGHRLVWLKDIQRALTVGGPDPDELVRRARADGSGPLVGVMLERTRSMLGTPVPTAAISALAPTWALGADRAARTLTAPIQLHERDTITRAITRSLRSSLTSSVVDVPSRGLRWVRNRRRRALQNETDDPVEKASYLRAVADAVE